MNMSLSRRNENGNVNQFYVFACFINFRYVNSLLMYCVAFIPRCENVIYVNHPNECEKEKQKRAKALLE